MGGWNHLNNKHTLVNPAGGKGNLTQRVHSTAESLENDDGYCRNPSMRYRCCWSWLVDDDQCAKIPMKEAVSAE